jgi:cytochrome P450
MIPTWLLVVLALPVVLVVLFKLWERHTLKQFKKVNSKAKFDTMPSKGFVSSLMGVLSQEDAFFWDREVDSSLKYGKGERVYHTFLGPKSLVVVLHPEDVQKILMRTAEYSRVKPPTSSTFHRMVSQSLGQVPASEWRKHRNILAPAFANLDNYVPTFDETIQHMLNLWDAKIDSTGEAKIEAGDQMQRMTLDVLGKTIFGQDLGSVDGRSDQIRDDYEVVFPLIFSPKDMLFPFLKTKEQLAASDRFEEGIRNIIETRIANKTKSERFSMLDSMIESVDNETNTGFTGEQLHHNVIGFFLAGHETTASVLGFTLYELAANKELQEKCREEVDRVVGKEKEVQPDHIEQLEYIPLVIKEMQRMYQATGLVPLVASSDTELGGYRIPKGTLLSASINYIHRDKQIWKDPDVFRPERFLEEESAGRHAFAYIPFSAGPHTCLGNKFSLLEQKIFYVKLLQQFTLDLEKGYKLQPWEKSSVTPGFKLVIKRRN